MFRARFKREILAEFLPPARSSKKQKAIILCDGMPSVPRKQPLMDFLSRKEYWVKLYSGNFYNPMRHIQEINPSKVMIFHAKDDPYVPWRTVDRFAKQTGSKIKMLARGGHLKTEYIVQKYWPQIRQFFES